ncbi:MAG: redoxin family protein [Pirellulaceae bacterium]|nr:redoxin family protein [Pirellulaceae bacterium]
MGATQATGEETGYASIKRGTWTQRIQRSDVHGVIRCDNLPKDAKINVRLFHPDFFIGKASDLIAASGELCVIQLAKGGTKIEIGFADAYGKPVLSLKTEIELNLLGEGEIEGVQKTMIAGFELTSGSVGFTVPSSNYTSLVLEGEAVVFTPPLIAHNRDEAALLDFTDSTLRSFQMVVRPTWKTRGRIVDGQGVGVSNAYVYSSCENLVVDAVTGAVTLHPSESSVSCGHGGYTDKDGWYEIDFVDGKNWIGVSEKEGYYMPNLHQHFLGESVKNSGIVDIELRKLPRLRGHVVGKDNRPIARFMVQSWSPSNQSVSRTMTDQEGRFDLTIVGLPSSRDSHEPKFDFQLIAFDPLGRMAGAVEVDLLGSQDLDAIQIHTEEKPIEWVLETMVGRESWIDSDIEAKNREEERARYSAGAIGSRTPDLSNGVWLNSDAKSLAEFRGKYGLLDFWFIGCGSCMAEMPQVKLVDDLFDKNKFAIVSVHAWNSTVDNVREFAAQHKMEYPIVVDGVDQEIRKEFYKLGIVGYPGYLLLDPEGRIVLNDVFAEQHYLRDQKIALIREILLKNKLERR